MSRPEPAERLVYASVVEGLLRHGLEGRPTARLKERLRQIGVDVERPLLPAYPVPLWFYCLRAIIEELYPGRDPEAAFRDLGARMTAGYGSTLVGRALYLLARLLGPRRMVLRLPHMLASGDNYTNAEVVERGPCHYEMRMNSAVEAPGYAEGIIEALLRLSGAQAPRVRVLEKGHGSTLFELQWGEALTRG
jgi:uncharacterized protein (TIGR02265 family)